MSRLSEYVWLLVAFVVLVMACPLIVLANGAVVSTGDVSAAQGTDVKVDVEIAGVTEMGAIDIWLQYDCSVVEVVSIAAGNLGQINSGIDNPGGVARTSQYLTK